MSKLPLEVMSAAIEAACTKAPDYDAHVMKIARAIMSDRENHSPTLSLRDAAITFRCPEGFEALSEALGMSNSQQDRARLDDALKAVIKNSATVNVDAQ